MLADMIVEEEFEIKEEEPWYDKQDLEHDLHLAAELGKTLLERNRELEQGLQQMYSTNQEQLQEIEYLTKQVDLLRQVNEQHAKVYEQLDVSARELEQSNLKLGLNNRAAQQKIEGLTETVDMLQTQVETLQHQVVEGLKTSSSQPQKPMPRGVWRTRSTHSISCLEELQNTLRYSDDDTDEPSDLLSDLTWREEEQASLRRSLCSLQSQFAGERARREEAEREGHLLAGENAALEQKLAGMGRCQARLAELEWEAEELRQLWRAESSSRSAQPELTHSLLPDSVFLQPEEEMGEAEVRGRGLKRSDGDRLYDHERSCVRRAEVVKYRGISLLNEVDAQYSALQVKYDELLRRCHPSGQDEDQDDGQTATASSPPSTALRRSQAKALGDMEDFQDDLQHQPEYKVLFNEIFTCIRKTEDLIENRGRFPAGEAVPISH